MIMISLRSKDTNIYISEQAKEDNENHKTPTKISFISLLRYLHIIQELYMSYIA